MSIRATLATAILIWLLLAHTASGVSVVLNPVDPIGSGFNDPIWGIERIQPVLVAAETWGSLLVDRYPGQTITLDISIAPSSPGDPITGHARTERLFRFPGNASVPPQTWLTPALASQRAGFDVETINADGRIDFTGPADQLTRGMDLDFFDDFTRLAVHEIGHVLGFGSALLADGSYESSTRPEGEVRWPHLFDTFLATADGTPLVELTDTERSEAYASNAVFWSGINGVNANGQTRPRILATGGDPTANLDHFDPIAHPDAVMGLYTGLTTGPPVPTELDLAILRDLGWETNDRAVLGPEFAVAPSPDAFLAGIGLVLLVATRRKRCVQR